MHKLVIGGVALALAALLTPPAVEAQSDDAGVEFSLGGGVTIPTGDFDDGSKMGWHALAAVSFVPEGAPVGFQVDANFSRLSDESPLDLQSQLIYGTGNVVYRFQTSEESTFRPYLIGGGGVYNLDVKGDDVDLIGDPDSETKFGINAGAGFDIKAGAVGLFVEGRFHNVFIEGSDVQMAPITAGIRFGGS
jgi:hypothetical protein